MPSYEQSLSRADKLRRDYRNLYIVLQIMALLGKQETFQRFYAMNKLETFSMEMRYFRKISDKHGYATISLPVELYRAWTENKATHVELEYDGERLTVSPA
jgi:hypothetical protein